MVPTGLMRTRAPSVLGTVGGRSGKLGCLKGTRPGKLTKVLSIAEGEVPPEDLNDSGSSSKDCGGLTSVSGGSGRKDCRKSLVDWEPVPLVMPKLDETLASGGNLCGPWVNT